MYINSSTTISNILIFTFYQFFYEFVSTIPIVVVYQFVCKNKNSQVWKKGVPLVSQVHKNALNQY